jgi:hypothetical protein
MTGGTSVSWYPSPEDLVLRGERLELLQEPGLVHRRRQVQRTPEADARRQRLVDERLQRRRGDDAEHLGHVGRVGADVAKGEGVDLRGVS